MSTQYTHHCKCDDDQDAALRRGASLAGLTNSEFIRLAIAEKCANYGVHYPHNMRVWKRKQKKRRTPKLK